MGTQADPQEVHGCSNCYEVDKGFYRVANDQKVCIICGGRVLNVQEAFDKIAELQTELDHRNGFYG